MNPIKGAAKRIWAPERKQVRDPVTGAPLWQMTDAPCINHNLYFTHPDWSADGAWMLFVSDRCGQFDLYALSEETGEILRLTDVSELNGFSAVPARSENLVYFTAGGAVLAVSVPDGELRTLLHRPGLRFTGCSLSRSEKRLVTTAHADGRWRIFVVETDGSGCEEIAALSHSAYHAQFAPFDEELILYASDITQRMWLIRCDGSEHRPLFRHAPTTWITHESWLGESGEVMFVHWPFALHAIDIRTDAVRQICAINAWHPSYHPEANLIVCDTTCPDRGLLLIDPATGKYHTLCHPQSSNGGTQWALTEPASGEVTERTYGPQWTHPHPSFDRTGKRVTFTSDRTGHSQVYLCQVEGSEPA